MLCARVHNKRLGCYCLCYGSFGNPLKIGSHGNPLPATDPNKKQGQGLAKHMG